MQTRCSLTAPCPTRTGAHLGLPDQALEAPTGEHSVLAPGQAFRFKNPSPPAPLGCADVGLSTAPTGRSSGFCGPLRAVDWPGFSRRGAKREQSMGAWSTSPGCSNCETKPELSWQGESTLGTDLGTRLRTSWFERPAAGVAEDDRRSARACVFSSEIISGWDEDALFLPEWCVDRLDRPSSPSDVGDAGGRRFGPPNRTLVQMHR
mmetsp:Transcript_41216/g.88557  ORF Transcript_41216/g.88557 Transcript_41216/m.88557 type:complete len:206 (+) Transcript_41216:1575-2192(+)